jgi:predicted small secreted protein
MRLKTIAKLMLAFGGLIVLPLVACNTVSGAGEDIQAIGQGLSNSADNVKDQSGVYPSRY